MGLEKEKVHFTRYIIKSVSENKKKKVQKAQKAQMVQKTQNAQKAAMTTFQLEQYAVIHV